MGIRARPLQLSCISRKSRQAGVVVPLFATGLLAIIAMAGLALDGGNMMLNKARLQAAVDAAALSGAKTLDQTKGNIAVAFDEAHRIFTASLGLPGNGQLAAAGIDLVVQFSSTLDPFLSGSEPATYVRVRATGVTLQAWMLGVIGINQTTLGASAVAGPSPALSNICNVAPLMVCGNPTVGAASNFGYTLGMPTVLKSASTAGGTFEVGPGNFQLIRLDGGSGANEVRQALAGGYDACVAVGGTSETEPGSSTGPVAQGLNVRFNDYSGPLAGMQSFYPSDVVVEEPTPRLTYNADTGKISYRNKPILSPADVTYFDYGEYQARIEGANYDVTPQPVGTAIYGRRTLAVPVGDCDGTTNGAGTVPVLGSLCFHLLQSVSQAGNEAEVFGEFIGTGCGATGIPGADPGTGPGPYVIQLYKDPDGNAA